MAESVYGELITNEPLHPVTRHFPHILRGIKLQILINEIEQQEIQQRKAGQGKEIWKNPITGNAKTRGFTSSLTLVFI